MGERRQYFRPFTALKDLSLTMHQGDVVGIVGTNGSGKSTFLQLACGTLTPSAGHIEVNGRVAALLELGAGFNPEFTGRENVYLAASLMGLSHRQTAEKMDAIIEFSGIQPFIDQPVKTYSSGMYIRLAFSLATSVDPDILIIDEALSVGDGDFSKRSFDRIMQMRDAGKSILFCSHSLFQVENLCNRVLWINKGELVADGDPEIIIPEYQSYLDRLSLPKPTNQPVQIQDTMDSARILSVVAKAGDQTGQELNLESGKTDLTLNISFSSPPGIATPGVAAVIHAENGLLVTSCGTWDDNHSIHRSPRGEGRVELTLPALPLLKGRYRVGVLLYCERGLYAYDNVDPVAFLNVSQSSAARGLIKVDRRWSTPEQPVAANITEAPAERAKPVIDFTAVQRLYQLSTGTQLTENTWRWIYPTGTPYGYVEYENLTPTGFIGIQPLPLTQANKTAKVARVPLSLGKQSSELLRKAIHEDPRSLDAFDAVLTLTRKDETEAQDSTVLTQLSWPAQKWTARSLGLRPASAADSSLLDSLWREMRTSLADLPLSERQGRHIVHEHLNHPTQERECHIVFNRLSGKVIAWCTLMTTHDRLELADFAADPKHLPKLIRLLSHLAYMRNLDGVTACMTPLAAKTFGDTAPSMQNSNWHLTNLLHSPDAKNATLASQLWLMAREVGPLHT